MDTASSSTDVLVRRAEPRDADALAELGRAVASEDEGWLLTTGDWRSAGEERRYLKAIRGYENAAVLVAETDGRIVGRLSVARDRHPASPHVADIGLMVAADRRGEGIGAQLLQAAVEWARSAGVSKLELHVFTWNEPALRLYERFGFEREGLRRGQYRRGGEEVDVILMAYRL